MFLFYNNCTATAIRFTASWVEQRQEDASRKKSSCYIHSFQQVTAGASDNFEGYFVFLFLTISSPVIGGYPIYGKAAKFNYINIFVCKF